MIPAILGRRLLLWVLISSFAAPLVYAGIADIDLSGTTRQAPPTMGALEVGGAVTGLPNAPRGLMLTRLVP